MSSLPRVIVVIPCYNHGHFLARAIESVRLQSYSAWEAIVVDDGSTDSTKAVSADFNDPRIQYIYQENQGLSAARNTGIRHAHGEYIAFLDADDEWEPDFLSTCVSVLRGDRSLSMVYTRTHFIDDKGNQRPVIGGKALDNEAFRERILQGGFFPPHAALTTTDVFPDIGLFDCQLTSVEDWDLWLRLAETRKVIGIAEPLARYRISHSSMSTNTARMHDNRMRVLAKHFGPAEGEPQDWPDRKRRAYGFAYWNTAIGYLQQQEPAQAWRSLDTAFRIYPGLTTRLDTFYELICNDQPKGYRGQAGRLDITRNSVETLSRLNDLFAGATPSIQEHRGAAFGNAYLALAMLADQTGDWAAARRYLLQAVRHYPTLRSDGLVWRRLAKLFLGQRTVHGISRIRAMTHSRP